MMTKIIGLTGGIGSGKTTLAKHLVSLGIPVYIADEEAKKLMNSGEVVNEIVASFGKEVLLPNQEIVDTQKLAAIVFNSDDQLEKLNNIIHPKVKLHFEAWLAEHQQAPLVVKEAAILFESGRYKDCDFVITITAPEADRISRVLKRDATTLDNIQKRMSHQWTDAQRIEKSDFVIQNTDLQEAENRLVNIINSLIKSKK